MNLVLETIRRRRSTRRFLSDPVPQDQIKAMLDAAVWTPSSMNGQPWHFTVIDDSLLLDGISQKANQFRADSGMVGDMLLTDIHTVDDHLFYKAPLVIAISGRGDTLSPDANVDCALAAYSIALAATSLELASCIIDLYNTFALAPEATDMLGLTADYTPYYGVSLGYPDCSNSTLLAPMRKSGTITYWSR